AACGAGPAGARCEGATGGLLPGATFWLAGTGPADAAPSASISATTEPSDSVSPTWTFSSFTTPACEDGTSIVALSDSSVTRPWSFDTVSPTATSTSITGTSSEPPMSGTFASTTPPPAEAPPAPPAGGDEARSWLIDPRADERPSAAPTGRAGWGEEAPPASACPAAA